ncbi:MAG: ROK family protein [Thermoanaerobaculia bacterium]|nr:ROK family protein [Thermoanaerobaculia bacterium]
MKGGAIVGIDLGGTNVRVGRVRGAELEQVEARQISSEAAADRVLQEILDSVDRVLDDTVVGIGCGVPSLVDVDRGTVYSVENIPSWKEVPLGDELEARYGIDAFINNDANAFAVGELYFGKARGYRDIVGLTIGTGLGAGIVVDGRLYGGSNCGAGEIGAMPYRGQKIESYCSGEFFQREAGEAGHLIFARAERGEPEAQRLFHRFGVELGHAILTVLYAYDPELLVLGGSISKAYRWFEGGLRERLADYAYPHALERLEIAVSEVENIAVLGAAALYLDARGPGRAMISRRGVGVSATRRSRPAADRRQQRLEPRRQP